MPSRGLDRVAASYASVRGAVRSAWTRRAGGAIEYRVSIPPNARGRIRLPAASAAAITAIVGDGAGPAVPLATAPGVTVGARDAGRVRIDVASGDYRFVVSP